MKGGWVCWAHVVQAGLLQIVGWHFRPKQDTKTGGRFTGIDWFAQVNGL